MALAYRVLIMSKNEIKIRNMKMDIKSKTTKIMKLEQQIEQLKVSIHKDERRLHTMCDHPEWVRCDNCVFDDICKYYCKKCGLWRNKTFYE